MDCMGQLITKAIFNLVTTLRKKYNKCSCCQTSENLEWTSFDDERTSDIRIEDAVSDAVCLLFYKLYDEEKKKMPESPYIYRR
jgi:hypothetical protein